ncbi:MAG: peptidoglycan DD-metalloendopeptidase family protein [Pseudomonadota bacterium]
MLSFAQTVSKTLIFGAAAALIICHSAEKLAAQPNEIGVIAADRLNLRSEPGVGNPLLKILRKGAKIQILEHVDGWLKISHQGQIGYIRNRPQYVDLNKTELPQENQPEDYRIEAETNSEIKQYKQKAETINQKIQTGKAKVLTFTQKELNIISSLDHIDLSLNDARKRTLELKAELIALEKQISETISASKDLAKKIEESEEYVSKRLVSLYKLNWLGRLSVLASTQSVYDLFQRRNALELILSYDRNARETLLKNKLEFQMLLARLSAKKTEKLALETDLEKQIKIMSDNRAKRTNLLEDIRNQRTLELAAIESLKQAAGDLNRVIKSLTTVAKPAEQIQKTSPKSFTSSKGLLNMPVKGKVTYFFGPYKNDKFNVVNFRSGIVIKAERGEPIRAVFDGKVLYASWFKGYGNMIIIDHGDNYYTVYAHAEELFVSKGDQVENGEVVATVGDTDSLTGPNLHFEVRHHGRPMNPLKWVASG